MSVESQYSFHLESSMQKYLKKFWAILFPPATVRSNKLTVQNAAPQPIAQQPTASVVCITPTTQTNLYLDAAWKQNNSAKITLPIRTKLWHGGIVGPNNPATNTEVLWTTRNEEHKHCYNDFALVGAKYIGVNAYLSEFETNKELLLADFNCYSLSEFTMEFCNGHHHLMKQALMAWLKTKPQLQGIVAINGGVDEVVISRPEQDLNIIQHIPLQPPP